MDVIWLYWLYGHIIAIKVTWLYKPLGYMVKWSMGYIVMG